MGIFEELGQAKETTKSGYFYPGQYLVELATVKKHSGHKGECVIIEGKTLAVRSSDARAPQPGETRAQVISGFANPERRNMALGDVKAFVRTIYAGSADVDAWTDEQWAAAGGAILGTALAGTVLRLEAFLNEKGTFTVHKWTRPIAQDFAEFGLTPPAA